MFLHFFCKTGFPQTYFELLFWCVCVCGGGEWRKEGREGDMVWFDVILCGAYTMTRTGAWPRSCLYTILVVILA